MSKKVYFLGAVIVLGAVALMAYCWHAGHVVPRRVLFVSASNSAFHEAVRDAFLETAKLRADGKIDVKVVSVPDVVDTTTVFAICEETLTMPADCIVVVGRILSQALVNLARKRKSVVPIVFVGVQSPLELGLVESLERPGGTVTGAVPVPFDDTLPGRLLHVVFPQIKTVLLPFCVPHDAVGEIREKVEKTKKSLAAGGVRVDLLPVDSLSQSANLIESLLHGHDLLMTLEADAINDTQFVGLVKLAERYNVGYFAGIMAALEEDVLFVYATELRYTAEAGFEQVVQILFHHKIQHRCR